MISSIDAREVLFNLVKQIAAEREAARPVVEVLLASRPEDLWDSEIPIEWRTVGFVQELTERAAGILEQNTHRALSLCQFALATAGSINVDRYPSIVLTHLKSRAWKEIGFIHGYQGAREASLVAQTAARRDADQEASLSHDSMSAELSSGFVLLFLRRFDEATAVAHRCETFFREYSDVRRLIHCGILRGMIAQFSSDFASARMFHEETIALLQNTDDPHTLAIANHNLGIVCTYLGLSHEARIALQRARSIFTDLRMPAEVERVDWVLAAVSLANGDFATSLTQFSRLRVAFRERGMAEDAAQVGLFLAEALAALGRHTEARNVTAEVIEEFRSANLNHRSIPLLVELFERLRTTARPREEIRHVRSFIERSRTDPDVVFLPLPD